MEACQTLWNWVRVTQIPATEDAIERETSKMNYLRAFSAMIGVICMSVALPLAGIMAKVLGSLTVLATFSLVFAGIILPWIAHNHPNCSQCLNTRRARVFIQCIMFVISFVSSLLFKFPEIYHYVSFGLTLISVNLFIITFDNPISFGARAFVLGFIVGLASALPNHKWATGTVGLAVVLVVFVFGEWVDAQQAEIDRAAQARRQNQQNVAPGAGQANAAQSGTVVQGVTQGGTVVQVVAQGVAQGSGQEDAAEGAGQEDAAQGGTVAQGAGPEDVAQGAGQEDVAQGAGQEDVAQGASQGNVAQGTAQENVPGNPQYQAEESRGDIEEGCGDAAQRSVIRNPDNQGEESHLEEV